MTKKGFLTLVMVGVFAFTMGYAATVKAWHQENHGYFYGQTEYGAWWDVWQPSWRGWTGDRWDCWGGDGVAIPYGVDTADEFINYVTCKLWAGNWRDHIGAAFMISTMTGVWTDNPSDPQVDEWIRRVYYAQSRGWIDFAGSDGCSQPNTFYQSTQGDIAYEWGCASGGNAAIIFYGGSQAYIIKRYCGNPVGGMTPLADDINFNVSGYTTIENQTSAARGSNPYPGDRLLFHHYVRNDGPTGTNTDIFSLAENMVPGYAVVGGWGNFGWFGAGETKNTYNTIVNIPAAATAGSQYCQRVGFSPINSGGAVDGRGAQVCATVALNFNLNPSIIPEIGGVAGGNTAEAGQTLLFRYYIANSGLTASTSVNCNIVGITRNGSYNVPSPYDSVSDPGFFLSGGCPRTFAAGSNTQIQTEGVNTTTMANKTTCRSLFVNPADTAGNPRGTEVCIKIVAKPYTRVYNGDISAGNGISTAPNVCTPNTNAAIVGWNKGSGSSYAGTGVQYAIYALNNIRYVSSTLGNTGGATTPSGLAFSNNTVTAANQTAGTYGKTFGAVPCIPDYYSGRPASAPPPAPGPNAIAATTSGIYGVNGNFYVSGLGNIDPGERITIYVNGNAYINSNIMYNGSGTWTPATMPNFQLIVLGNIFVDRAITQLDGFYVAQANGGVGGEIYTCADTTTLPNMYTMIATSTLYSKCNVKLTVNGAFVAKQVRLMRTAGTLQASNSTEASTSANIAEVFNYNPALWLSPPQTLTQPTEYDSIVSLPPIL